MAREDAEKTDNIAIMQVSLSRKTRREGEPYSMEYMHVYT